MKRFLISFLLIITFVCNCPCVTYASGSLSGWDTWTKEQKVTWWTANVAQIVGSGIGLFIPNNQVDVFTMVCSAMYDELMKETSDETYEDWLCRHLGYNSETQEITMDDELTDFVYNASVQYIEEETPWYTHRTADSDIFADYYINSFSTKAQYDSFKKYVKENNNKVFYTESLANTRTNIYDENGVATGEYAEGIHFKVLDFSDLEFTAVKSSYEMYNVDCYDSNWEKVKYRLFSLDEDGNWVDCGLLSSYNTLKIPLIGKHPYNGTFQYFFYEIDGITSSNIDGLLVNRLVPANHLFITYGGQNLRMYKSLADLKSYSVGQRPYYITDAFNNYDSTVDNSTTITQTEIDNSVTYGDVYNYITNNYENSDDLTEDELRAILEEYLSQIGGGSGSGSGGGSGGSDDGGSSGGGLGSFLEGLGSIGDAILSILGKLLEYIGKALELLTGTVTKVLDLIPSNITNLLLGLFPFIPQEWVTAIELSLVLGVVLAVVGAFKK